MTDRSTRNVAASVHQRLLNAAKATNRPFNELLQYYAIERFLFRLSKSQYADRFVLKGALTLLVWQSPITRPTRDIDLLGRVSNDLEAVGGIFVDICRHEVDADGLIFDPSSVTTFRIAEDADYEGVRATFRGYLGNARIAMQVDIGFSDVVTPGPVRISYPTILDNPAAQLQAYNRETVVAEKFEAMGKLGTLNSRMKDFFDVWVLSQTYDFDGPLLAEAIRTTFARRQTTITPDPVCFSDAFARDVSKASQWKAFVRNGRLVNVPAEFSEVAASVRRFLLPVAQSINTGQTHGGAWPRGGPWHS